MRNLISPSRRAFTLIELLVTLALMAILASVVTLAVRVVRVPPADDPQTVIADSLRAAVASGRTIEIEMMIHHRAAFASVTPDGGVFADSAFGIDPMSGRARAAK